MNINNYNFLQILLRKNNPLLLLLMQFLLIHANFIRIFIIIK